ncbi:LysR family transcriptional regulator [Pendulispora brunnea]|uniref:LysR family transcriptional regulator n=1 Tax=Pendulispora brunnea TaxID=2905690 RepID=A0ABZ2JV99_9BACT
MDLEDVHTFVNLATTCSFSRTADELHLTQPAVTRRLQRLETAVGAALVDRTRRPLRLTPAGRLALEACRHLLNAREELLTSVSGSAGQPLSEIRLGVAHALTEHALLSPVDQLRRARPDVRLVLTTGWSHDLLGQLKSGRLDAALVLLDRREKLGLGLQGQVLANERLVAIAARSLDNPPHKMADFGNSDWILNPEGCAARAALEQAFHRAGAAMRVIVETYTYELQMALVAQARGLGLVPARLLARSSSRRRLQPLALDFPGQDLHVWLAARSLPSSLESAVAALAAAVVRSLGDPDTRTRRRPPHRTVR